MTFLRPLMLVLLLATAASAHAARVDTLAIPSATAGAASSRG